MKFKKLTEAYMSQEMKQGMVPKIKHLCQQYGVKGSLRVRHHSSIVFTIREGKVDFMGEYKPQERHHQGWQKDMEESQVNKEKELGYLQVNEYHYRNNFVGESLEFLNRAFDILMEGNHDNSDIQSDYFDVGWYVNVNIGEWDKPYKYTGNKTTESVVSTVEPIMEKITVTPEELTSMSISDLAIIAYDDWKPVNYAAKPYLEAMTSLQSVKDNYGMDSGYSVIAYFLSNASQWKGDTAKAVKAELKKRLKRG